MDEHCVPTLAMDEFDWILSRTSSVARTKLHPVIPPPLKLVRILLCLSTHSWLGEGLARLYPVPPLPAYVRPSFVAPKYQTDVRALSWYKLVTYLCVGRCVIYTASGPSALGCVNHAASYTTVCNLYVHVCFESSNKFTCTCTIYLLEATAMYPGI